MSTGAPAESPQGHAAGGSPAPHGRPVGLLAGNGRLPVALARAAGRMGRQVVAVALTPHVDRELAEAVSALHAVPATQWQRILELLLAAGVEDLYAVGKVPKTILLTQRLDERSRSMLGAIARRNDDSVMQAYARDLELHGMRMRPQTELLADLLAPAGPLTRTETTPDQQADIAYGYALAKRMGDLDVGQTVVVKHGCVLAVEAIEGTDDAIRRGTQLGGAGSVVVKVAKPNQDPRFDVPTIGVDTVTVLAEVSAAVLAVEAGRTFVVDRAQAVRVAEAAGISIVGIGPQGGDSPDPHHDRGR